jgi:hypothetical protein
MARREQGISEDHDDMLRDRAARIRADAKRYPLDPVGYAERVRELEAEGMCTSDAQGVADVEFRDQR